MCLSAEFSDSVKPHLHANRWVIAFSGGIDSTALLQLAVDHSLKHQTPPLLVLHINHGLSVYADTWQQQCEAMCKRLNVPFECVQVQLDSTAGDLENAARNARYKAFEQQLAPNDVLMLGHHRQDQSETVLYRLFRGAGVKGLKGIPKQRPIKQAVLLRPLLHCTKQQIQAYAHQHQLSYAEDDSNSDDRFDRNYIRQHLIPAIEARWPAALKSIHKASSHMADAHDLLDELALLDVSQHMNQTGGLSVAAFSGLSAKRIRNAIRYWLQGYGLTPAKSQYLQIETQLLNSRQDAKPSIDLNTYVLKRFNGYLYCEPANTIRLDLPSIQKLNTEQTYTLGENVSVSFEPLSSGGIYIAEGMELTFVGQIPNAQSQRFKPAWRRHSTTLKKLMQAQQLMPWHRNTLAVLQQDAAIVAVAGIGVAAECKAKEGQAGYRMKLQIGEHIYLCE